MQKRWEIADEDKRVFLSVSSINAIPESADEKSDKESDTEYLGVDNSKKYMFIKSSMSLIMKKIWHHSTNISDTDPSQLNLDIM